MNWTRITNDVNGNPRYVCHFFNFIGARDFKEPATINDKYAFALERARKLGGKKFHNKQYGGGVVFQSYNIDRLTEQIQELVRKENMSKNNKRILERYEILSD